MCGICGLFNVDGARPDLDALRRMRSRLAHRGPDDEGEHVEGPAALGFRRLSILDLERGHQPMSTADGRYTIVFNGEIYNHLELRRSLGDVPWRTHADTETILELFARRGPAGFAALDGMFALAVWDARERRLWLARDPLGIKPLYYSFDGRRLAFSSELRSLLAGGLSEELDAAAVVDYLSYGKVHAPRTILREALKLEPGRFLRVDSAGLAIEAYWKPPRRKAGAGGPAPRLEEAVERLDALLSESVKASMLSDVPVGAFLSGGVDSSLVAGYMAEHAGSAKVQTFCVGFEGAQAGVDESRHAREAARWAGCEHHELLLPATVLERLDDAIGLLDEPIADSAILPTYLLSQFARKRVKVVLTGEGADELFAGYDRYKAAWVNERLKRLPSWGRRLAAPMARRLGKGRVFSSLPIDDAREWALATASARPEELKDVLHAEFWETSRKADSLEWLKDHGAMDELDDALVFDLKTVLCDSLLMKVDKSAMRASLEARVPFLNKAVVDYALSLPSSFKIRHFKGKYLLRRVAQRRGLPRSLAWRRKHGFIVPWEAWVRRPDNAAVSRLLDSSTLRSRALFDLDRLKLIHAELSRGSRDVEAGLFFRVVVLGLWLDSLSRETTAACA